MRISPLAILFALLAVHGSLLADDSVATATLSHATTGPAPRAILRLRYNGVYRLTGAELRAAGVPVDSVRPRQLQLWHAGQQLPLNILSRDATRILDLDHIEFVGSEPRGTYSYYLPNNLYNIYELRWGDSPQPLRYSTRAIPKADIGQGSFIERRHHEKDLYYTNAALPPGITDNFFWFHFKAGQQGTFPLLLDFPGLAPAASHVDLRFRIFGFTEVGTVKPQHKFGLMHGDYDLGTVAFNGKTYCDFETSIPLSAIKPQKHITFTTPPEREDVVDWISLDSIDVAYPRLLNANGANIFRFTNEFASPKVNGAFKVEGVVPGTRVFSPAQRGIFTSSATDSTTVAVASHETTTTYFAVSPKGYYHVDSVEYIPAPHAVFDVPENTDVLILSHAHTAEAASLLADYRRSQGLRVFNANVSHVFTALNHGFIDDVVLKRYIRYVKEKAPGLQYLVLFGDSTYDYRESKKADEETPSRILIPIHWVVNPATTWTGGYPDDNWYGSFGRFNHPDIAVGRIPANDNYEGIAYIRKVIEYENLKKSAKDKAVLVSSVEKSFQDLVRETQTRLSDHFTTVALSFPETDTATVEVGNLRSYLNQGVQLLYYVGHGGAMVWRVGPTDFTKQKDLFTPQNVAQLKNRHHYPIIATSTCYMTSFDQDLSLGESFLISEGKGAIAVMGTPWKSTVYEDHAFNKAFFEFYLDSKVARLGDAFLKTRHSLRPANQESVDTQSFTLLGDPLLQMVRYK